MLTTAKKYLILDMSLLVEGVAMSLRMVRNVIAIGCLIVLLCLIFTFVSGRYIQQRLDGVWVRECGSVEYVFAGNEYSHSMGDSGYFRIRGNMIYFDNGSIYNINVRRSYMVLNGIHYLRRD